MIFRFFSISTDAIGKHFRLKMHRCPLDVLEFLRDMLLAPTLSLSLVVLYVSFE